MKMRLGNSVSCAPLAAQFNLLEYFEALHHAEMLLKFSKRYLTSQGYRTLNFFYPRKQCEKTRESTIVSEYLACRQNLIVREVQG